MPDTITISFITQDLHWRVLMSNNSWYVLLKWYTSLQISQTISARIFCRAGAVYQRRGNRTVKRTSSVKRYRCMSQQWWTAGRRTSRRISEYEHECGSEVSTKTWGRSSWHTSNDVLPKGTKEQTRKRHECLDNKRRPDGRHAALFYVPLFMEHSQYISWIYLLTKDQLKQCAMSISVWNVKEIQRT